MSSPFTNAMTTTENGAVALASSGNAIVDLFFQAVRGIERPALELLVKAAWSVDELMTLKLLFHRRDIRGGVGERRIFTDAIQFVANTLSRAAVTVNLALIPEYGRWDDLCVFYLNPEYAPKVFQLFKKQLDADLIALQNAPSEVSLCAKWFPSEGSLRFPFFASKFCKKYGISKKRLRTIYLVPLRKHLHIVETFLCNKELELVDFNRIPSRAMLLYRNVFNKSPKFQAYMAALQKPEAKMTVKAQCIDPHEIVAALRNSASPELLELQWEAKVKSINPGKNVLCVCDVSGSMMGTPLDVCIALGIMISSCADEAFRDNIITFSYQPAFHKIVGATLCDRINNLSRANWDQGTNFEAVFDLILERSLTFGLKQEELPEKIIVFSDMEFDEASRGRTNYNAIVEKFTKAEYRLPTLVFWNLRGDKAKFNYPVLHNELSCVMVSGFNINIVNDILGGKELSPLNMVKDILAKPRYDAIKLK